MTIIKEAQEIINTKDHVLVILFNHENKRGVWNHSLAFIRKPFKTQNIMLILDANKARDQKIFCFPKCPHDLDLPYLEVDSSTDLINKNFCYMAEFYTIEKKDVTRIGNAEKM